MIGVFCPQRVRVIDPDHETPGYRRSADRWIPGSAVDASDLAGRAMRARALHCEAEGA